MIPLAAILGLCLSAEGAVCSWYGFERQGKRQANGQPFDCRRMTCATWQYPMGTWLTVTHRGRSVRVLVTDRGPAKRLHRDLDLSLAAFRRLADPDIGLINAEIHP